MHLRCTLGGFKRSYLVRIPSNLTNTLRNNYLIMSTLFISELKKIQKSINYLKPSKQTLVSMDHIIQNILYIFFIIWFSSTALHTYVLNESINKFLIVILSNLSVLLLLIISLNKKKDKKLKFLDSLKNFYEYLKNNKNKMLFKYVFFLFVMSICRFLFSQGIIMEDVGLNTEIYKIISCIFPTLYFFHVLSEISKIFQVPVLDLPTGKLRYPSAQGKPDFSLTNMNYSIYQLLAIVTGFSFFHLCAKPFLLENAIFTFSKLNICINKVLKVYEWHCYGILYNRINTHIFRPVNQIESNKIFVYGNFNNRPVNSLALNIISNFELIPDNIKKSKIIPRAISAFHPPSLGGGPPLLGGGGDNLGMNKENC